MDQPHNTCQPYLIIPHDADRDSVLRFTASAQFRAFACAMLTAGPDRLIDRGFGRTLIDAAVGNEVPILFEADAEAAAELGADGVHIDAGEAAYIHARQLLGDELTVGAQCGLSRHNGLTMAEMGADYIAFSGVVAAPESEETLDGIIGWWSEITVVPCVAWDMGGLDAARAMAQAGADFVSMGAPLWADPSGPEDASANLATALTELRVSA